MMPTPRSKTIPQDGDVVWDDFDPIRGNEQAGSRPAIILSTALMHEASRMAIICPITSNLNPWPAKVFLPEGFSVAGAILVDQVRSVDRTMRGFRFIARVPDKILAEVRFKLAALIGIDLFAIARGSGQS